MKNYKRGQVLLIVVLVMVIALTIGLSVVVRTITNIRTSSEDEASQRAFSAAEAGIERALNLTTSQTISGSGTNSTYTTDIVRANENALLLNNGVTILRDEPVDLLLAANADFSGAAWNGTVHVSWGQVGVTECSSAALEIVIVSGSLASPTVRTFALDPCTTRGNSFSAPTTPGDTVTGKTFAYKTQIAVTNGLIARIIPLYGSSQIGIRNTSGNPAFPVQGSTITSTGTSETTVKRKIVSFKGHPKLPIELFPYILFSP